MKRAIALLGAWFALVSASPVVTTTLGPKPVALDLILGDTLPPKLSDFRFFRPTPSGFTPNAGVIRYTLNTPLFSDYTEKYRYIWMPKGQRATYSKDGVFTFPVGTALIKTFGYPDRLIETRILLRRASGWVALPYVWNEESSDAELKRAGKRVDVTFTAPSGQLHNISYAVPNANQCKGCHDVAGVLTPIGPKARNLNDGAQLQNWRRMGMLDRLPTNAPAVPRFDDERAPIATRARAYLDVNCGHCHNKSGPANTSGLWLDWHQKADTNLGLNKRPTAAGRGSAGHEFAIAPGKPGQSYLISRMESLDPGIAMPELGRATVDAEGVALLKRWIAEMK